MRKSWVRVSLAAASAFAVFGQASAQSVHFWYNSLGDPAANQPSVINVNTGDNITLSVYLNTSGGVGALSGLNLMFGYSTTSSFGAAATPDNTDAVLNSYVWGQADLTSNEIIHSTGGGGPNTLSGTRPYGLFLAAGTIGSPFAGTADGVNFHVADISLHINAAAGTDIPINIWSYNNPNTDVYASAVLYAGGASEAFPSSPYMGTLHVNAVPEPATLAALGIGAAALLRRRRRSK